MKKAVAWVLTWIALLVCTVAFVPFASAASPIDIRIAAPQRGIGYLPLYVGIRKGFYAGEGLNVSTFVATGGTAHVVAVLSGQAWGMIGGPERNALGKDKDSELRAIAQVVDRANVYLVKRPDVKGTKEDLTGLLKGKTIAVGPFGTTPHTLLRYLLKQQGVAIEDVKLIEVAFGAELAVLGAKRADLAITSEPFLSEGVSNGIWSQPIVDFPQWLGPYAYSTINILARNVQAQADVVERFRRANRRSLEYVWAHRDEALAIAREEFPSIAAQSVNATVARAYADQIWSRDGSLSERAWEQAQRVQRETGLFKKDVPFEAVADPALRAR